MEIVMKIVMVMVMVSSLLLLLHFLLLRGGHLSPADGAGAMELQPWQDAVGVVDVVAWHLAHLHIRLERLLANRTVQIFFSIAIAIAIAIATTSIIIIIIIIIFIFSTMPASIAMACCGSFSAEAEHGHHRGYGGLGRWP
jgi:hypothetical protein